MQLLYWIIRWWLVNEKVRNFCWRGFDELYEFTYYVMLINGQTHMYLIATSIKIITKCIAVVYRVKSARMVSCWDLCECSWAVICQYSWCYQASMTIGRSFHHVPIYVIPIQLLLCVNKRLTTSIVKYEVTRQQLAPVMVAVANIWVSLTLATHACRIFMLHKMFYCAKIKW